MDRPISAVLCFPMLSNKPFAIISVVSMFLPLNLMITLGFELFKSDTLLVFYILLFPKYVFTDVLAIGEECNEYQAKP